jgi:hypothetical protein
MDALGNTLLQYQKAASRDDSTTQPQEAKAPAAIGVSVPEEPVWEKDEADEAAAPMVPAPEKTEAAVSAPAPLPADSVPPKAPVPPKKEKPKPKITVGEDGIITLSYEQPSEKPAPPDVPEPEPVVSQAETHTYNTGKPGPIPQRPRPSAAAREALFAQFEDEDDETFPRGSSDDDNDDDNPPSPAARFLTQTTQKAAALERMLTPLVQLLATKLARRQMQKTEAANWPDPVEVRQTPELSPRKAGKFYTAVGKALRFRVRIASFLCLILAWICFQLPMAGMLGQSVALQAGVSLVLTLAVMVTALDVVTAGFRQLFDLHPALEALATLATLFSCVDAATVMLGYGTYLPFCAIGAISLTTALWSNRLTCTALRRTMKTVAMSKSPSALAAEENGETGGVLLRSELDGRGLVRRSEQPDLCQTTYARVTPLLLLAALVLAIAASLGGQGGYFLHTFSALLSVGASFAAFFAFPLPYSLASKHLQSSGVAIAGYAGCADIGKTRKIVLTDEDLFPPGTLRFSEINILEGVFVSKVVSSTASLLARSGSGVMSIFHELMTRRGYDMVEVEQFQCHEGGGLSGMVAGERVLVGSAGFMNLMGIRLPQNLNPENAICTAMEGELVGVFTVEYVPVTSVQNALVTLLRGKTQAIFALRDFNITPRMIRRLFRMPTDNFNFPPFRERYRMAGATQGSAQRPLAAIITRSGMLPLVDAAESGRRLYTTCRINTVLALVGTAVGMFILFLLCRAGSFDTANAGNVLSFMLLWALPAVILSLGQNR